MCSIWRLHQFTLEEGRPVLRRGVLPIRVDRDQRGRRRIAILHHQERNGIGAQGRRGTGDTGQWGVIWRDFAVGEQGAECW